MKKTTHTNKLVLDRQTIRQLTDADLAQPVGGWYPETRKCGADTGSCVATCNQTACC